MLSGGGTGAELGFNWILLVAVMTVDGGLREGAERLVIVLSGPGWLPWTWKEGAKFRIC